jgi:hypothetical protein
MKPNWQKQQQEQMRRQQEQLHRQQQMAAWAQQQKQKEQQQAAAGEQGQKQQMTKGVQSASPAGPQIGDRFARVEAEVARLRGELNAGRLNEEQFEDQLKDLMVQDAQGVWWMMGAETGQWHRNSGDGWVRADPPRSTAFAPAPPDSGAGDLIAKPSPRRFWGCATLLLGIAITAATGFGAGNIAYETLNIRDEATTWLCAGVVWLGGLIVSIVLARKVWRRG